MSKVTSREELTTFAVGEPNTAPVCLIALDLENVSAKLALKVKLS